MRSSSYPESAIGMLLASHMHLRGTWLFQGGKRTSPAATPCWVTEALSLCYLWENELETLVWDESWTELGLEPQMPVSLLLPESRACGPSGCARLWHNVAVWCCFGARHASLVGFSGRFAHFPLSKVGRTVTLLLCKSWVFVYSFV